jgi:hypothetical protein
MGIKNAKRKNKLILLQKNSDPTSPFFAYKIFVFPADLNTKRHSEIAQSTRFFLSKYLKKIVP